MVTEPVGSYPPTNRPAHRHGKGGAQKGPMDQLARDRALRATMPLSFTFTSDIAREYAGLLIHVVDANATPEMHVGCDLCAEARIYAAYAENALTTWRQAHPWQP